MLTYRNFDLEAYSYDAADRVERFRVRVLHSPAGEQRLNQGEAVALSDDIRSSLRLLEHRQLRLADLIRLGEGLGAALFPPRIRWFLDRSLERLAPVEGLRIRLRLDTYALADLPWEYAYLPDPDTPIDQKRVDGFLVLNPRLSLVRYEPLGHTPGTLDSVGPGPVRLVVLLAAPKDPEYPPLRLDLDERAIQDALADLPTVTADVYGDATLTKFEDALGGHAHLFHFSGHGEFRADMGAAYGTLEGAGSILLMGEDGRAVRLNATVLAQNLAARGVRLAVLGACEGGRRDGHNAWTGVVPALTHADIPAVIGMQYTIGDSSAVAFNRGFYRALTAGEWIDAAMTAGRLAILTRSDPDERDWGVPVLYLRAECGVLLPQPQEEAAGALEEVRDPVPRNTMEALYQWAARRLKVIAVVLAVFGMTGSQFLNLRPSDSSFVYLVVFTLAAGFVMGSAVFEFVRLTWRAKRIPADQGYDRRERLRLLATIVATPVVVLPFMLLLHIPNTWPLRVNAGSINRAADPWISRLPGHTLLGLPSDPNRLGYLFKPDPDYFVASPVIHRITVKNRGTTASPRLRVRLSLEAPPGQSNAPGRVTMAAVVSPVEKEWLAFQRPCQESAGTRVWCFLEEGVHDASRWLEPTLLLPAILSQGRAEIYLEFALLKSQPTRSIPALIVLDAGGLYPEPRPRVFDLNLIVGSHGWAGTEEESMSKSPRLASWR